MGSGLEMGSCPYHQRLPLPPTPILPYHQRLPLPPTPNPYSTPTPNPYPYPQPGKIPDVKIKGTMWEKDIKDDGVKVTVRVRVGVRLRVRVRVRVGICVWR